LTAVHLQVMQSAALSGSHRS